MSINTACISLDRYLELLDIEKQLQEVAKKLEETIEPLAEYKKMCEFFSVFKSEANLYKDYLENEWMHPIKPSKDCLTAMAEVSWHDCFKAVNAE